MNVSNKLDIRLILMSSNLASICMESKTTPKYSKTVAWPVVLWTDKGIFNLLKTKVKIAIVLSGHQQEIRIIRIQEIIQEMQDMFYNVII